MRFIPLRFLAFVSFLLVGLRAADTINPTANLVVEGVRSLVDDAEEITQKCRTISTAIDDSIIDFDELDVMVGQAALVAAKLDQVDPR